jgi:hypothetical protein
MNSEARARLTRAGQFLRQSEKPDLERIQGLGIREAGIAGLLLRFNKDQTSKALVPKLAKAIGPRAKVKVRIK